MKEIVKGILEYSNTHHAEYSELKELFEQIENKADFYVEWNGEQYRIIADRSIWPIYKEGIEDITRECYLPGMEIPHWREIDWEATAQNCLADGYGHHFSSYDGGEVETSSYRIFRVN